jgi:hypothetical protein
LILRKYFKFVVLSLFAILILWYFGRSLDWAEVWNNLRRADPVRLAIATLIICLGYLLRAFRWRTLLAPITESRMQDLFATTTIGFAAVFLVGRAGEVVRPLWLPMRDNRIRPSAALVTIGLERICDLVAIVLLFALNLLWFQAPQGREAEYVIINRAGLLMLIGSGVGLAALAIFARFSQPLVNWFENFFESLRFVPKSLKRIFISLLKNLAASLQILRDPKELALVVFWTAAVWLAIWVPTYLVLSAFGLPLSFSDALFIMGWAVIGSLVPTPGGAAGAFHATTGAALMFMNVNRSDAAAAAIVLHLVYFAPALLFGFYYFFRGDISWSRFRSLIVADETESSESRIENKEFNGTHSVSPNLPRHS